MLKGAFDVGACSFAEVNPETPVGELLLKYIVRNTVHTVSPPAYQSAGTTSLGRGGDNMVRTPPRSIALDLQKTRHGITCKADVLERFREERPKAPETKLGLGLHAFAHGEELLHCLYQRIGGKSVPGNARLSFGFPRGALLRGA